VEIVSEEGRIGRVSKQPTPRQYRMQEELPIHVTSGGPYVMGQTEQSPISTNLPAPLQTTIATRLDGGLGSPGFARSDNYYGD